MKIFSSKSEPNSIPRLNVVNPVRDDDGDKIINYARGVIMSATLLVVFGLTMLYSTSYGVAGAKFFQNQVMWAVIGTGGGILAYYIGYRRLADYSFWMVIGVVFLLAIAFFGPEINGANRWIRVKIPGFTTLSLQPSELAKLALAFFVATYCAENLRTFTLLRDRRGIVPLAGMIGLVLIAIIAGRDFGTTLLVAIMAVFIMVVAGMNLRYILVPMVLVALVGIYIVLFDPTRLSRVTSFLDPVKYQADEGYQLWTSLLALGSGGWTGQGFMGSRLKAKYLPEAHTDFILSIVGEELGFLAMIFIVMLLYALFTYFALKISLNSQSRLGMLLGFAIASVLAVQALINIAVISGGAPTKGMPAPFISYGGSNLLTCLIAVGVLLSIAAEAINPDYNQPFLSWCDALWARLFKRKKKEKKS